ncbi:hypothetical protein L1887_00320 [Cichorium endivia]|nr:hypothetical protein L1887_00320 [Cichorium endivia]
MHIVQLLMQKVCNLSDNIKHFFRNSYLIQEIVVDYREEKGRVAGHQPTAAATVVGSPSPEKMRATGSDHRETQRLEAKEMR